MGVSAQCPIPTGFVVQISDPKHPAPAPLGRTDENQVIPDTRAIIDGDRCPDIFGRFLRPASRPVLFLSACAYQEGVSLSLAENLTGWPVRYSHILPQN